MVISISQVRFDRPVLLMLLLLSVPGSGRKREGSAKLGFSYICMYVCLCVCNVSVPVYKYQPIKLKLKIIEQRNSLPPHAHAIISKGKKKFHSFIHSLYTINNQQSTNQSTSFHFNTLGKS